MFKRDTKIISDLVLRNLRLYGLEGPLLQKRLIDSWGTVAGEKVASYTTEVRIGNQTLFVKISNPAVRSELSMRKREYINKLNAIAGATLITDIRFY